MKYGAKYLEVSSAGPLVCWSLLVHCVRGKKAALMRKRVKFSN